MKRSISLEFKEAFLANLHASHWGCLKQYLSSLTHLTTIQDFLDLISTDFIGIAPFLYHLRHLRIIFKIPVTACKRAIAKKSFVKDVYGILFAELQLEKLYH